MISLVESSELHAARDRLIAGDVVAIPTETVYGLAASIMSTAGLKKIFSLKERPDFDPLIVHVASFAQAHLIVREWPPIADFLARSFWPGPLTLVLPKSELVSSIITAGLDTVAVRYPAHPVALDLIRLIGVPLAAPSANKFGKTSPSKAQHVRDEFPNSDLLVIDGGDCDVGVESTVISFAKDNDKNDIVQILRPGAITSEMISQELKRWGKPVAVNTMADSLATPGHLKHHYMPKIPMVIVPEGFVLNDISRKKMAEKLNLREIKNAAELNLDDDALVAARDLYSEMRELTGNHADLIYVRAATSRQNGLWIAIWDRLTKAASLTLD